jgi:hypothetical protein
MELLNKTERYSLLLVILLIFTFNIYSVSGQIHVFTAVTILHSGVINYSPPSFQENNLIVLPDFFIGTGREIDGIYTKYPVAWQGKANCIELAWNPNSANHPPNNAINEIDGRYLAINPGDRIVFKAWMYAEDQTSEDSWNYSGARIGFDLYDDYRITEIGTSDGMPSYTPSTNTWADLSHCCVQRGTNRWTYVEIDFVVQSRYEADGFASYPEGEAHVPTSFTAWFLNSAYMPHVLTERGRIWIWNPELYINP